LFSKIGTRFSCSERCSQSMLLIGTKIYRRSESTVETVSRPGINEPKEELV